MHRFNIRVYGILINDKNEVLVSDELIRGMYITKFPGGGLEFGEGTRDCLRREFEEELNLKVEVGEHIYTTDYFQMSAFNPEHQIISIYYKVTPLEAILTPIKTTAFDFDDELMKKYKETKEIEVARFIPIRQLSAESMTLPIDKIVADTIKEKY